MHLDRAVKESEFLCLQSDLASAEKCTDETQSDDSSMRVTLLNRWSGNQIGGFERELEGLANPGVNGRTQEGHNRNKNKKGTMEVRR
jgi:hypothetical protein